jgi:hypothetical protein
MNLSYVYEFRTDYCFTSSIKNRAALLILEVMHDKIEVHLRKYMKGINNTTSSNKYILDFIYRQTQQCTNPLTHISMCITECIGDTILLHVSVHRTIFRQYINYLIL